MKTIKVIFNPLAGRGRGARIEAELTAALTQTGLDFDLAETEYPGHGIELATQARRDGYDLVVAAGGDGTISEVVNGLVQAAPLHEPAGRLGLLPIGSGNDFATMVGCPVKWEEAVQRLAAGEERLIDLGHASWVTENGTQARYFDNNMGVGLEAAVTLESYSIQRLSGSALYVAAALKTLRGYQSPDLSLVCELADGELWRRSGPTLMVSIGNSPRAGGGLYLTPDALLDDGLLDVGVADAVPTRRVLQLLPMALWGKHVNDSAWTALRVRHLHITCVEGVPVQLDGEVVARQVYEVSITAHAGRLVVVV
jgi:YegS/Rv2252/BmrU family lipid kinase